MAKYPSLVPKFRRYVYGLRIISTLLLAAAIRAGTANIGAGLTLTGIRIIVGALGFAAVTWVSPYSPWVMVFLALPVIILPISSGSGILFAAITVAILLWLAWRRTQPVSLDAGGVRRVEDDAVMPKAVRFVAEFEGLGWRRRGAAAADLGSMDIILAVLISPDAHNYVEVTDVVIAITSVFSDGRTLVTRNSASSPMSEWVLANDLRGSSPTALATGHTRALEILASSGVEPMTVDSPGLIDFVIGQEKLSIESASGFRPRLTDSGRGTGPIDNSPSASDRISEWRRTSGPDLTHLLDGSR